jgi:hypothetical protein
VFALKLNGLDGGQTLDFTVSFFRFFYLRLQGISYLTVSVKVTVNVFMKLNIVAVDS